MPMFETVQPVHQRIAADLAAGGWSVQRDFLPPEEIARLRERLLEWWAEGDFQRAGVGRGPDRRIVSEIRGDYVRWLELGREGRFHDLDVDHFEPLRLALNQSLYLGLWELEAHVTLYPPGAYYVRHLDVFRGALDRVLSVILYLNDDWCEQDGGALRIELPGPVDGPAGESDAAPATLDVLPRAGTLVVFLSDRVWHAVQPARRDRLSFTGWFRRRS
jgi:SM-20-related protein